MDKNRAILSDIIAFTNYARHIPSENRRETWTEIVMRNAQMHIKKFPELEAEIWKAYSYVLDKKVLPSMRSAQFAGPAVDIANQRIYNCAFLKADSIDAFPEVIHNLLIGTGVGYSVLKEDVEKLPPIKIPKKYQRFLIGDSIAGWADAVKILLRAFLDPSKKTRPKFDYRDIREKGSLLVTSGGKAPGPEPLKIALTKIEALLEEKEEGSKLTTLEVHDIMCHLADAVLAGGIRRAAMIAFFSDDDYDMMACKTGKWYELNPQRARANNSVVFLRSELTMEKFYRYWEYLQYSGSGEPGFILTNDKDVLSNPCVTGDTRILTNKGYFPIETLVGQEVSMWNGEEWSKVTPFSTGINPLVQVTLSNGIQLKCTPYHKFILHGGEKVEAGSLEPGDKLEKFEMPVIDPDVRSDIHAYTQGFYSGDGTTGYNWSWLYSTKFSLMQYLEGTFTGTEENRKRWYHGPMLSKNFVPINESLDRKLDWLSGLLDADGNIMRNPNSTALCINSINHKFLEEILLMLSTMGVQGKVVRMKDAGIGIGGYQAQDSFRLLINASDTKKLLDLGLNCVRLDISRSTPNRDARRFITVVDVQPLDREEETFCVTEKKRNRMTVEGIVTGNCGEISLRPFQFCNLTSINGNEVHSQEDLETYARVAAFIGTLQASYTDFYYLRPEWAEVTEDEALIGVSVTGWASGVHHFDLEKAANVVLEENERVANLIGINKAARTTTTKPEGSSSLILGSSSGIHSWHSKFYLRRKRVGKNESIYKYLNEHHPELVEDEFFSPETTAVISIPIKAPEGAITRHDETAIDLLERIKDVNLRWIKPGHRSGPNMHNVSATVSVHDNEWIEVRDWVWKNRDYLTAITFLPFFDADYKQMPFEEIDEDTYNTLSARLSEIDLTQVREEFDTTNLSAELACAGGNCEVF